MTSDTRAVDSSQARVVVVSAFCVGLGASLGFVPGFVATTLMDDLSLSRSEVGLLVSVHFGCTGVGSMLGGRLTEVLGARIVIVVDMAIVCGSALFAAAVGTYWALMVAAVCAGFAYSLANAGTNVAIGRSIPVQQRTMALSLKTAGVPLMAVVAGGVGPITASKFGWPPVLVVAGGLAAAVAVVAAFTFDDDRPTRKASRADGALLIGFGWFPVGAFLLVAGSQPLYSWTVAYLEQALDTPPGLAGGVAAGASAGGVVVMVLSARFADRKGPDARMRRLRQLICATIGGTILVLIGEFVGFGLVALGCFVGIGAQLAAIGTMHAAVVDRVPHAVAYATGVTMTGYYLGALVAPVVFGVFVDVFDRYTWGWGLSGLVLVASLPAWSAAARSHSSPSAGAIPMPAPLTRKGES